MTPRDLAVALRDMMSMTNEVETGAGEMVAIDVHLDLDNVYVIAGTREQFRVSVTKIA